MIFKCLSHFTLPLSMVDFIVAFSILKYTLISHNDFNNPCKRLSLLGHLLTPVPILEIRHVFLPAQGLLQLVLFCSTPRVKQLAVLSAEGGWIVLDDRDEGVEVVGHVEVQRGQQGRRGVEVTDQEVVRVGVAVGFK